MNIASKAGDGIWFVYDGDCPICNMAATMFRVKKVLGNLNTVNARVEHDHWLMPIIEKARLDLDEGMVVYFQGRLFHGDEALRVMAEIGDTRGWYNRLHVFLFKNPRIARFFYPWIRGARNMLISLNGAGKINSNRNE